MDEITVSWTVPKPVEEMTEEDWDALAEQVLDDTEAAVAALNES